MVDGTKLGDKGRGGHRGENVVTRNSCGTSLVAQW